MTSIKIYAPIRKRMILVFDVETTGLLPKKQRGMFEEPGIESYPYIIQLSFVLYDIIEQRVVRSFNSYVRIPENIEIPELIVNLTGITKENCQMKGDSLINVLDAFYEAYMMCEVLVAHNMDFDEQMILIELQRNRHEFLQKAPYCMTIFNKIYEKLKGVERFCTMKKGTDLCNIMVPSKIPGNNPSKKWPRLEELHQTLFGEVPVGMHDAAVDTDACLRCYLKMRHAIN